MSFYPPVTPVRKCLFSIRGHPALDAGSSPSRHPALDAGSRQKDWIPVFTGMTHPFVILNRKRSASDWGSGDCRLDSRFHENDTFFVIPHLMRDPFRLDSRLRGNDKEKDAGMTEGKFCVSYEIKN